MRNLIVCTLLLAYAVLPFQSPAYAQSEQSQNTTDKEQSQATGYEEKRVVIRSVPTAYNKLTAQQKERVDRVLALLRQPPEDRPPASQRLRNHPSIRAAMALQSNAQAKDIDCLYDENGAAGCWIDLETFCWIIWEPSCCEIGCFLRQRWGSRERVIRLPS